MAQYLLSVHHTDGYPEVAPEVMEQMFKDVDAFNNQLKDEGAWIFAGGLHPAESATTVRFSDGELSVTDGPYAETKEQIGGFWVIEAADLDAALAFARRGAAACQDDVEVRPFQG